MTDALVRLADQLGVAVTELWRVAKSMPVYQAMSFVPATLVTGIVSVELLRRYRRERRRADDMRRTDLRAASDIENGAVPAGVVGGVVGVVSLLLVAVAASHLVGLLNPDAYALEYILNHLSR